jgi:predicted nuclease with TOPRIM domain
LYFFLSKLEADLFEVKNANDRLKKENTRLAARLDALVEENKQFCKRFEDAEKGIEELEMYSRRNGIRIFGVAESADENCVKLATSLFKSKLNINNVSEMEISRAHRVGKPTRDPRRTKPRAKSFLNSYDTIERPKLFAPVVG